MDNNNIRVNNLMGREAVIDTLYCHFSFRRPKGKSYGLFAVALYTDYNGKHLVARETRRLELWQNHQFVTAAQSYKNVLDYIYRHQVQLKNKGIKQILLVTDNGILAGWIENHRKNKGYTEWMDKATEKYRVGSEKEITIAIGLCEIREYEKSYKYCKEEFAIDENRIEKKADGTNAINVSSYKNIYDTMNNSDSSIEIKGDFTEV